MKRVCCTAVLLALLLLPSLSPAQSVDALIQQGVENSQSGRYDQAIQSFEAALKLKPNDPGLITFKGIVYYAQGKNDLAMQQFEAALKINPNFGRAYYQRAMVHQSQDKFDKALPDLEKAKGLGYPVDPDFIALIKRKMAEHK